MSLHLVVEADDERALARGLQGLGVRIAKALMNFLHHFPEEAARYGQDVRDPFSSTWREPGTDPPVVPARTWLLSVGWRRCAGKVLVVLASDAPPHLLEQSQTLTQ